MSIADLFAMNLSLDGVDGCILFYFMLSIVL
jgi:hypothetical protein